MSLVPCPPPNPTKHNACQVDKSHRTTKEHETSILASSQIFITALILLNHISFSHVFLWPLDAEYLHNYQTFILLLSLTSSYTEYSGLGLVWNLSLRYSLGNTQPGRSPWNNGFGYDRPGIVVGTATQVSCQKIIWISIVFHNYHLAIEISHL